MPAPHAMILHSGGLRSLVATALLLREQPRPRLTFIHIHDGRANHVARQDHVRRQADAFEIARTVDLSMPHLYGHGQSHRGGATLDGQSIAHLATPQMLAAGLAQCGLYQSRRLVYPAACNAQPAAVAQKTEQALLVTQLGELELEPPLLIDLPLIDFTDAQIIEIGVQLNVPWHLAWSCIAAGDYLCGVCTGCQRRTAAFETAGVLDPAAANPTPLPRRR